MPLRRCPNVRVWLKADLQSPEIDFRFTPRCYEAEGFGFNILRLVQSRSEGVRCYDDVSSSNLRRTISLLRS
jgi:hypothetical protein